MPRTVRLVLTWSLAWLAASGTAAAHHSFSAAFDMNAPVTVKGTIVEVRLENPHSWFFLDVPDANGKVERWSFEAGTPSGMIRNGFKPGVIKKGVTVTIKGVHARDLTQNTGMLQQLITADGTVYGLFGSQQTAGAR